MEFIFNDISNIKRLEETNAELKFKTIFLSKVAHEFKNPLICISEIVNEIEECGSIYTSDIASNLKQLKSMSDYLLLLIKDLDYFSNIQIKKDAPSLEIELTDINEVTDICQQVAGVLIIKFNKTNVKFQIENNLDREINLFTDSMKLKQTLINLISNAIKFTHDGYVKLILSLNEDNLLKFEVNDCGIGMNKDQIENIYKPFCKGNQEENKYGSGLGLYIVTQILDQLESKLIIKSSGTSFYFFLKINIIESIQNSSYETLNLDISLNNNIIENVRLNSNLILSKEIRKQINLFQFQSINQNLDTPIVGGSSNTTYKEQSYELSEEVSETFKDKETNYYIVVDDEKITRKSCIRILNKTAESMQINIKIIEAEDGIECLYHVYKLIKKGLKLKAIISDEMMSHLNGSKSAEILKSLKNLRSESIPFYLLTAYPDVKSEFIDYLLSKPLNKAIASNILNQID